MSSPADLIYLRLADPTQAAALVADLDTLYGAGYASVLTGSAFPTGYTVALQMPPVAGSPDYFDFDFTTVVNAGPAGAVGSVAVTDICVTTAVPEPASLAVLLACGSCLFTRKRPW